MKLIFDPALIRRPESCGKDVAVLAERVLVEEEADRIVVLVLDQVRGRVMHDLEAVRLGLGLDRRDVHVFGEPGIDVDVVEFVGPVRAQLVRLGQRDDDVRLADVPLVEVAELTRGGGMSAGLPAGAPASTHFAMVAISASVSDGSSLNLVMPTWRSMYHGGISRVDDLLLDRARPRPRVLVGQQRHRRDRARAMAVLTGALQDRRDVLAEGDRRCATGCCARRRRRRTPNAPATTMTSDELRRFMSASRTFEASRLRDSSTSRTSAFDPAT